MSDLKKELYVLRRGTFDGINDDKKRVRYMPGDKVMLTARQANAFKDAFVHSDIVKKEADLATEQAKAAELATQLEAEKKANDSLQSEIAALKAKAAADANTNAKPATPDAKAVAAAKAATDAKAKAAAAKPAGA